jgi:hypothetical protein
MYFFIIYSIMVYSQKKGNFWLDDISIIYDNKYLIEIIPRKHYDLNRKLNAIVRFTIYYSLIMYIVNKNVSVFCIPFICMISTIFIKKMSSNNADYDNDNLTQINTLREVSHPDNTNKRKLTEKNRNENTKISECNIPTQDNPFMNLNVFDIGNKKTYGACPSYNNPPLQKKINKLFEETMFMDTNDIFKHNNSQNRFYTMPNTEPANDTDSFMKWLYLTPPTCKENNSYACLDNIFTLRGPGQGVAKSHAIS